MGYIVEITSDLYYKPITIVNYNSRVINNIGTSLNDDARVIIYDHHMFIVQATGINFTNQFVQCVMVPV